MIYALLVGINEYQEINPLKGCENDVKGMVAFLNRFGKATRKTIKIKCLINEEATRFNIIHQLKTFFDQAKKEDVALFYFSGHGTKEKSPHDPSFRGEDGDDEHDAIVPYDSNFKDGKEKIHDIADKELRVLYRNIVRKDKEWGPELITIFDCCHSGGMDRDDFDKIRHKNNRGDVETTERTKESFLEGVFVNGVFQDQPHDFPHIHLGACAHYQTAEEDKARILGGKKVFCGKFTYTLISLLEKWNYKIPYSEITQGINLTFETLFGTTKQTCVPSFSPYAISNKRLLRSSLERGAIIAVDRTDSIKLFRRFSEWVINLGSIHGLEKEGKGIFQIFQIEEASEEFVGVGIINKIRDTYSTLLIDYHGKGKLLEKKNYVARPSFLPLKKLRVKLKGPTEDFGTLPKLKETVYRSGRPPRPTQNQINTNVDFGLDIFGSRGDLNQKAFATLAKTDYTLIIHENSYELLHSETQKSVFSQTQSIPRRKDGEVQIYKIAKCLIYLAAYERSKALTNSNFSKELEKVDGLRILFYESDNQDNNWELSFGIENEPSRFIDDILYATIDYANEKELPRYTFKVFNKGSKGIWPYLVNYLSDYKRKCWMRGEVSPGSHLEAEGQVVPKRFTSKHFSSHQFGVFFNLFLATRQTNFSGTTSGLSLEDVLQDHRIPETFRSIEARSNEEEKKQEPEHWFSTKISIKFLKTLANLGNGPVSIANDRIRIDAPQGFHAKVSLSSSASYLNPHPGDVFLKNEFEDLGFSLYDFSDPELPAKETNLEMHGISGAKKLSKSDTLDFSLTLPDLKENQEVLVVSLPERIDFSAMEETENQMLPLLAFPNKKKSGTFEFSLSHIPKNPDEGRLEKGKSLKISFVIVNPDKKGMVTECIEGKMLNLTKLKRMLS